MGLARASAVQVMTQSMVQPQESWWTDAEQVQASDYNGS